MNKNNQEQEHLFHEIDTQTTTESSSSSSNHKCQIITPSIDYLNNAQILTDVLCTVPNCNEIFSNTSALNLHIKKVHKLDIANINKGQNYLNTKTRSRAQRLNENCKCKYYCPANNCKYNYKIGNGARYLPSFHSLKIHFIRIHGEKMYSCSKCSRKFSIKSEMYRHEEKCGQLFKCSCGCPFSTIELLIKHAQLQSHCIPPYNELLTNNNNNNNNKTDNMEPMNKKAIQLKPLKPNDIKSQNHTQTLSTSTSTPNIIIINNIAATPTSAAITNSLTTKNSLSSSSLTTIPFNNLIINKTNNMLTATNLNEDKKSTNLIDNKNNKTESIPTFNLFKLPYIESCQRSLGCQTQNINDTNKIETASQTPILNIYHSNNQILSSSATTNTENTENTEIFKYYETQQTQTIDNFINELNLNQFDASTSPLNTFNDDAIINDDQFWAEISTQTFLSAFEHNNQQQQQQQLYSINNQINYNSQIDSIQQFNQQNHQINFNTLAATSEVENREMQTCDISLNTTFTQTSQSTATSTTETNNNDFDLIDTIILNNYKCSETQTNDVNLNTSPNAMHYDNFIQTSSIQTQTFNEYLVDNITQTPWNFNICDDDLLF